MKVKVFFTWLNGTQDTVIIAKETAEEIRDSVAKFFNDRNLTFEKNYHGYEEIEE